MADNNLHHARRQSRSHSQSQARTSRDFYNLGNNPSHASIFEDVEMAHEEVFAGPIAESLPSSVSAFSHRISRVPSNTSFTYFHDDQNDFSDDSDHQDYGDDYPAIEENEEGHVDDDIYQNHPHHTSEQAMLNRQDSRLHEDHFVPNDDQTDRSVSFDVDHRPSIDYSASRRRSSTISRNSVHARLLRRDSTTTNGSVFGRQGGSGSSCGRRGQKIHMTNEDLTIFIAGFRSTRLRTAMYILLCIATGGLAFLLMRWLPTYKVKIIGTPAPLRECDWVVIENQWGEISIVEVNKRHYGRQLSSIFGSPTRKHRSLLYDDDLDIDPIIGELRAVSYRYVNFFFHPLRDKFVLFSGWKDPEWTDLQIARIGISSEERSTREQVFGQNLILIKVKPTMQLLVDEVLHPFYVFQIASLVLWSMDEYYYYAFAILLMSVVSIGQTLRETKETMMRLRAVSIFDCDVRVLRNGFWRYVNSSDLVPGDVYEVCDPRLSLIPCDSLLLSGDCMVNESMLTGESIPITKTPATNSALRNLDLSAASVSSDVTRHFLYNGTKIIRARRPNDSKDSSDGCLALVVRTGFSTTKGALVRSMMFPKPSGFKFYRDSFRYISVMGAVAAVGFCVSLVNFVRLRMDVSVIIIRALDLITIVVPPALPATLSIGTNFAISRLKKQSIFCISPQRVNVGGKLDIMCFDKTGTLTEDGLDVLGVRPVSRLNNSFCDLQTTAEDLNFRKLDAEQFRINQSLLFSMATCHTLRDVDGEMLGDPLDLKMFEFTRWTFEEGEQRVGEDGDELAGLTPSVARPPPGFFTQKPGRVELGVVRSFEFISRLRRCSVVVKHFGEHSGDVYVKGAPECMRDICRADSFPSNYDELLSHYTHMGYRVIGCATKHIKKMSWLKTQKLKRNEVESDLEFLGFIIFENRLKPSTKDVLIELHKANINTVMVTGDNILTAISVARECTLLDENAHCFVPRFVEGDKGDRDAVLQWESINRPELRLDAKTLLPDTASQSVDVSLPNEISNLQNYSIAVSGDAFRWLIDFGSPQVLERMLVRGKVFARMSPDEKHELVEKLQSIDYMCGFCGDGANDCGALKAADVGISLSEAEASVAAPFTSRVFEISCVPTVIREGRAALVTSFSCFKYMSLYSAIQFCTVSFLYAKASNLGDFQFLYIDLAMILPIAIFMGWGGPSDKLCRKKPTANLVSRKVLVPLLGQMIIIIAFQALVYILVRQQSWYIPPVVHHKRPHIKNSENTALFLMSCFEYIFIGVVLNAGPPFRVKVYKNWPFLATIAVTTLFSAYMLVCPDRMVRKIMELTKMDIGFRLLILCLGPLFLAVSYVFETYVFLWAARQLGVLRTLLTGKEKQRKKYKVILEKTKI
ncbi:putative cation-transporting ATPase [Ceratocystis fimbriata CBS 114723]|uniref:Cation-transporting ATPase n=1 Tax=Ceratocystis fimbriata CBS 114723 TaxID=1035309 RepID=A0A2C5X1F1_9PEZI|nr:putative cation-transporting ATPase [Ceratocystis fimbriata CBS 114723]